MREDNQRLASSMLEVHGLCDDESDVATASLLEVWIDETQRRVWFLFEAGRTHVHQEEPPKLKVQKAHGS